MLPLIQNCKDSLKRELDGYLYGIGEMGRAIGIFDANGASNSPTIKSNWAWWRDCLVAEAEYMYWVKCGLIPEKYQKRKATK